MIAGYETQQQKTFWKSPAGGWLIVAIWILAISTILGVVTVFIISNDRASLSDMSVKIVSCKSTGGRSFPAATVGYEVTNNGTSTRDVAIKVEYRDSSGARVDTDTAHVRGIRPGETVHGEESTMLDAPMTSGGCVLVGIS